MDDALNDPRANRQICEQMGIHSVLVIPLALKKGVIGAMFLNYHAAPKKFIQEEVDFARKLSASVSLALENARAFQKIARMECRLKETIDWYVDAIDKAPIAAIMVDSTGKVHYFNEHLLKLTGLTNEDIMGKDWFAAFLEPGLAGQLRQEFDRAVISNDVGGYRRTETRIRGKGDRRVNVQWYNGLIHNIILFVGRMLSVFNISLMLMPRINMLRRLNMIRLLCRSATNDRRDL
jgi:PAS domain S-box-containing protein